ncbi:unnamed protein product [Gordionus sp. m RMFG-2023]|uniref:proteasome subunit beta type-5-like n=1 Tax=Gordionus sp. m RMFG-2023 TaxID=3053472 RepID=UPI0030E39247
MALESVCNFKRSTLLDFSAANTGLVSKRDLITNKFILFPSDDPIGNINEYIHNDHNQNESGKNGIKIKLNHGTTTLAFQYQGGIVVAVDSRATAGGYIASQTVNKVLEISPFILGTMAGGAADCQYWERVLSKICRIHELRSKERISVAAASKTLANIMYNYKGMGLSMGTMICGWDKKGPSIYYVDNEAARLHHHLFSVGSGSVFAYPILDTEWKQDLTTEDALNLGVKAIFHATYRDAGSGGCVNLFHIDENGWKKIGSYDVFDLYYKYQEMHDFKPVNSHVAFK